MLEINANTGKIKLVKNPENLPSCFKDNELHVTYVKAICQTTVYGNNLSTVKQLDYDNSYTPNIELHVWTKNGKKYIDLTEDMKELYNFVVYYSGYVKDDENNYYVNWSSTNAPVVSYTIYKKDAEKRQVIIKQQNSPTKLADDDSSTVTWGNGDTLTFCTSHGAPTWQYVVLNTGRYNQPIFSVKANTVITWIGSDK